MPFFSEYLFPTNPIALGVTTFLMGFFSVWFIGLVIYWRWLRTERKRIENNQNIQPLVNAQQERDRGREDNDQEVDPENTFSDFCEKSSLNRRSPITKHLKSIFVAGWNESRLEGSELINHTTSELFKWNNLFRSTLAVFIVIGLLGTLFGLTDSLVKLAPALRTNAEVQATTENNQANDSGETSTENSKKMVEALSKLMDDIKGAFAPSIWGIIFTIVGVILYGFYLQFACHPVKSVLERLTLTVWVPKLYPTTSQRLIQTLQQSESQIQKGFETAAQFSESVEKVHGNIDEFNESLKQASAITQPLSDSVTQINKAASDISAAADTLNTDFTENLDTFSREFTSSVTHLTGFQDEIRKLHQEFQEAANEKLDQHAEKVDQQNQNLVQVSNALNQVLRVLKDYETAYIDSRKQIDETLQAFINKATETNTSIYEKNQEWFKKVNADNQQQLSAMQDHLAGNLGTLKQNLVNELKNVTSGLAGNLSDFQKTLDSRLKVLNERLKNFDTPLKETVAEIKGVFDERLTTLNERLEKFNKPLQDSANQMRDTYADSVRYMQGIFGNLQQEINKQNKEYEAQLIGVRNLNTSVLNLLKQLDESSSNQSAAISTLNSKVENLTENTQNLAAAITSFTSDSKAVSDYVAAIERHTETLGNTSQQFVEKIEKADVTPLNTNIGKLNATIEQISQNSQTLANAVNQLTRQIDLSRTSEPEKRSFFSKLNPFSRRKTDGK